MIVPMEKLSLLIFHKDYQTFLGALRERGVVHVHENKKKTAEDEQLKQKLVLIKRIGEMLRLLGKRQQETESIVPEEKGAELLQRLENSYKRQEQIEQQLTALKKDGILYEPWGTFSKERIDELGKAGWEMRFFTVPDRKYMPEWEEKYNAFVINQEKGQKYFVTFIPKDTEVSLEADAVVFPQLTAEEIQKESEELKAEKEQLEHYLNQVAASAATALRDYRLEVYEDTDELKIEGAARKVLDDKVIAIEGWVPEKLRPEMEQWLSDKGVYSLPNYREIDLTPFFAPFFVLFFGFCLGDAGYGLLLLIGISIYKIKAKPAIRPILSLAQWLGASTVVMGIVSGTFFGIQLLEVQVPWVVKFRSLMLDSQQLFNLALIIGGVQIIFGMFLKVANLWKQYGFSAALSTIGWLILILGEGVCFLLSTKGYDTRIAMYLVGGVASVFIFLLNNLKRNVFINIGAGLWDSYNMITGLLGDTLSYIRLFALGISSAVLGLVFNDLAINMSGDIPGVKQLVMLIILVFGHSVNLFMAGLGSFVHPMRLTFVEFYKNAGFEGGGKKYQPFRRRKSEV